VNLIKTCWQTLSVAILVIGSAAAQHLDASAVFANGSSSDFTLKAFDTANNGSGTITDWNNEAVNWAVTWTRDGTTVQIFINGNRTATLDTAAQNSNGGGALLNDGANSGGTWTRN
jgi:hypothetical protein